MSEELKEKILKYLGTVSQARNKEVAKAVGDGQGPGRQGDHGIGEGRQDRIPELRWDHLRAINRKKES